MAPELSKYIDEKYRTNWFDYAKFHCIVAGIPGQEIELLNEVMVSLLAKSEEKLINLYRKKKKQKGKMYTELDFFVLRMIKLNAHMPLSPYRYQKEKRHLVYVEEYKNVEIPDIEIEPVDTPAIVLEKFHLVEKIVSNLDLSENAIEIFRHKFIKGLTYKEWRGKESIHEFNDTYNKVIKLIKRKINGKLLI